MNESKKPPALVLDPFCLKLIVDSNAELYVKVPMGEE
jgi:hypothetical protein